MKKIALILAAVMMMTALAACGGGAAETTAPVETTAPAVAAPQDALSDLFVKLYEQVPVELPVGDFPVDLADEYAVKTYVGADSAEGITEALTSESMIGAQAFSITLVRAENDEAAAKIAQTMFEGIDTRKWICVEATDKQAASYGNLAVFIMVDPELGVTSDQLMQGFATVFGGEITNIIK